MALTQEQWYQKIKGLVPGWFFENENYQKAHEQALAKLLATVQQDIEDQRDQSFILRANEENLNVLGEERSVERLRNETNEAYAVRVQNIGNNSNLPAIERLVNSLLIRGVCQIIEGYSAENAFFSRGVFFGRDWFFNDFNYNFFAIAVDSQVHPPYSFFSRDYFTSRENFFGSDESANVVMESVVQAVNKVKAHGVLYKIVER